MSAATTPMARGARVALRFRGDLGTLNSHERRALLDRTPAGDPSVAAATARIIADVRTRGDAALYDMARTFDRVDLSVDTLVIMTAATRSPEDRTSLLAVAEDVAGNINPASGLFFSPNT